MPNSINFRILNCFKKEIKKYQKKFPNIKDDIIDLLESDPFQGASPIGRKAYKVRVKSSDLPRGKSKSLRLIFLYLKVDNTLYPISLYLKGDKENITYKELNTKMMVAIEEIRGI